MLPRPSRRWRRHAEVYRFFAEDVCPKLPGLDFSEQAAREAFDAESNGARHDLTRNGFAIGKQWANVQVAEWKHGIADGLFLPDEFLGGPHDWWAREALKGLVGAH